MVEKKVSNKDLKTGVKLTANDNYELTVVTPKKIIITCDDYGAIDDIDRGVERAIKNGSINSVAVFPNFTEHLLDRPDDSIKFEHNCELMSDDELTQAVSSQKGAKDWLDIHGAKYDNYAQKIVINLQSKLNNDYTGLFEIGAHLTISSGYPVLPPQYIYDLCVYTDKERNVIDEWYSDLDGNERKIIINEFGILDKNTKKEIVKLIEKINNITEGNVKKWYSNKTEDIWNLIKIHCKNAVPKHYRNRDTTGGYSESERIRGLCNEDSSENFTKWYSDEYSDKRLIIKMFLLIPRPYIYFSKVGTGEGLIVRKKCKPETTYHRVVTQFQKEMTAQMCVFKANNINISFISSHCGAHEQNSEFFAFTLRLTHYSKAAMRSCMVYPSIKRGFFKLVGQKGHAPTDKELLQLLGDYNHQLKKDKKPLIKITSTMNSNHYGPVPFIKVKSEESHIQQLQKKQKALEKMIHDLIEDDEQDSLEILVHAIDSDTPAVETDDSDGEFHVKSDARLNGCNNPIACDRISNKQECNKCDEYWNNCDDVELYARKSFDDYFNHYVSFNYPQVNPKYYQARVVELQSIESPIFENWEAFKNKQVELAMWSELPAPEDSMKKE
ncbi:MAG: hypothetical protein OCD01_19150 [Fibrobacterales bacterium]